MQTWTEATVFLHFLSLWARWFLEINCTCIILCIIHHRLGVFVCRYSRTRLLNADNTVAVRRHDDRHRRGGGGRRKVFAVRLPWSGSSPIVYCRRYDCGHGSADAGTVRVAAADGRRDHLVGYAKSAPATHKNIHARVSLGRSYERVCHRMGHRQTFTRQIFQKIIIWPLYAPQKRPRSPGTGYPSHETTILRWYVYIFVLRVSAGAHGTSFRVNRWQIRPP